MMKRLAIPFILVFLAISLHTGISQAMTRDGAVWVVGCTGFTNEGGSFLMNRDNTGLGREQFTITATDGAGNVIFGPVTESFLVGGRIGFEEGTRFDWASTPLANPLTVRVVSSAGNGLPEQIVYTVMGACPGITTTGITLGQPSTSAEVGNPEAVNLQPGSIIVNTFRLNVRSGDGVQFSIIGQLSGGQQVAVLGVNARRTWWYVQAGDLRGWIRGDEDLVFFRGDLTNTPILHPQGDITPPRFFLFSRAMLYTRPDLGAPVICSVPGNTEYVIELQNNNSAWFGIRATCDGQSIVGWVFGELGAVRNPGELPIPFGS